MFCALLKFELELTPIGVGWVVGSPAGNMTGMTLGVVMGVVDGVTLVELVAAIDVVCGSLSALRKGFKSQYGANFEANEL